MADADIWKRLTQAADRGDLTLRLRPDELKPVLGQLDTHIKDLDELMRKADALATVTGLGNFAIGAQLAKKYAAKGAGPDSISARLDQLRDAARTMQNLFTKSVNSYLDTDAENVARCPEPPGEAG
jgi:hypothetical protein